MNLSELSITDLDVIKRNLESKMEMINKIYLEYDSVQKGFIHFQQPLIFDFEKRKESLKNKFDELSPLMNEVVTEIDAKVSKKIGISFSFQEELMNDIKNIDYFKNSLNEKMNNNKLNA